MPNGALLDGAKQLGNPDLLRSVSAFYMQAPSEHLSAPSNDHLRRSFAYNGALRQVSPGGAPVAPAHVHGMRSYMPPAQHLPADAAAQRPPTFASLTTTEADHSTLKAHR